jgi:hypothetical protein
LACFCLNGIHKPSLHSNGIIILKRIFREFHLLSSLVSSLMRKK